MKRNKGHKLALHRETLHLLEPADLRAAAGNITTPITPQCTASCNTCAGSCAFSNCSCVISVCLCSVPVVTCA